MQARTTVDSTRLLITYAEKSLVQLKQNVFLSEGNKHIKCVLFAG
jgi:hypothetical protein